MLTRYPRCLRAPAVIISVASARVEGSGVGRPFGFSITVPPGRIWNSAALDGESLCVGGAAVCGESRGGFALRLLGNPGSAGGIAGRECAERRARSLVG